MSLSWRTASYNNFNHCALLCGLYRVYKLYAQCFDALLAMQQNYVLVLCPNWVVSYSVSRRIAEIVTEISVYFKKKITPCIY